MHGYMMPSIALKNNPQIIFTWLHYAATTGARMPAKSGNSRLCAISSQKLGEELPASAAWAQDFNLTKDFGALNSGVRTAQQTEIGLFWTDNAASQYSRAFRALVA